MKRQKLSGMHLWEIDTHFLILTRAKSIDAAIKKGKKFCLTLRKIVYVGVIDA